MVNGDAYMYGTDQDSVLLDDGKRQEGSGQLKLGPD